MLKSFKIKDEYTLPATFEMLISIYSQQVALGEMLVSDFCKRTGIDIEEGRKIFDRDVAKFRNQILEGFYAEWGDLNEEDLK